MSYKLVLMDWKMHGMDGIEVSKRIKENPKISSIPAILMVTAYGKEEIRKHAESVGIDHFLTKPVNRSLLFDAIMCALGHEISGTSGFIKETSDKIKGLDKIRGANILLVEDNLINQQVDRELLESKGFNVTVAGNGKVAIACINNNKRFDAVLMDIQMPEMDGYETTQMLRKDGRFNELAIIAMTAHAMAEEKKRCLDVGINDHISKPIEPKLLFSTLVKWIPPRDQSISEDTPKKIEKNEAPIDLPVNLTGLNMSLGLEKIGGNKKLYKKVLRDFYSDYTNFSDKMTNAYLKSKMEDLKQMTHTIKGVSGNIGADDLYGISKEIDECLKTNQLNGLDDKLQKFSDEIKTVLTSIHHLIQTDTSEVAETIEDTNNIKRTININELMSVMDKTDELLSQSYPESEDVFDSIKNDLIHLGFKEETNQIFEYIEDFEYNDAKKMLAVLKDKIKTV
ncbi:MAG: response regulator [Desulfobacterales bacterium]|nr:response regulator [Desulfobacterales bacterium]